MDEITKKEIELFKLGFKYNEHQESYYLWQNGFNYYVDRWELEGTNINIVKDNIIKDKRWMTTSNEYKQGVNSAQKEFKKEVKDKYNHYNSKLKEATKTKLDRRDRTEYIIKLEAKVELLKSIIND